MVPSAFRTASTSRKSWREYNILRECIHDLADSHGLNLQGMPFHIINRVLGHAIGLAVQTYATQKALEVQNRREEYLAFVAHDLRTPLNAISLVTMVLEQELSDKDKSARITQMFRTLRRNVRICRRLSARSSRKTRTSKQRRESSWSAVTLTCGRWSRPSFTISIPWQELPARI